MFEEEVVLALESDEPGTRNASSQCSTGLQFRGRAGEGC
jgi:hypothetical protein